MTLGKFTYGLELEWSDVDRRIELPPTATWNKDDATLVNSDGQANDPTMKKTHLGGEINTKPTDSIEEQVAIVTELRDLLSPLSFYRANLHVHVGVEGLKEDLDALKQLFQYTQDNQNFVYFDMLPYTEPTEEKFPDKGDLKLAKNFYRQQNYWAKQGVPLNRAQDVLNSTTCKEFYDYHFQYNEKLGRRLYHIGIVRAGINIRAIFKHGTTEFRVFAGTTDPEQVRDALEFAKQYMEAALYNPSRTAREIYESKTWNFPQWQEFLPELEKGFLATKHKYMEYPDPNAAAARKKIIEKRKKRLGTFTYGAELEWSDCDARIKLPEDCGRWSPKEWTIVNSDGRANDPTLQRNFYGGEINTLPTDSIERQVEIASTLRDLLDPKALYRGSLQLHIGVPGLVDDVEALKSLFDYTIKNQDFVFTDMLPRERPREGEYPNKQDYALAMKFNRQKNLWTKQGVPPTRWQAILDATTPQEFYDGHFHFNERLGKRQYHIGVHRAGINVRSVFAHGTVEFRCFPNTTDPEQIRDCFEFARQFVEAGLYNPDRPAKRIYESREWNFPTWAPFDVELEKGFIATAQRPNI